MKKLANLILALGSSLVVWLASGCSPNSEASLTGPSPGATTNGGTPGSTPGATTGTPGCNGNATPPTSPSDGTLTIDVNGTSRQYVLELPQDYDGKTPKPVLFAFHGTGSNAKEFLGAGYGNVRSGAAGRVILVGPNGLSRDGQTGWIGFGGNAPNGIDQVDVDFFDALVAQLQANYCVDPARVFSMGHSAGGFVSNQLGCIRRSVLRGVGPFAGGGPEEGSGATCGGKVAAFIGHNPRECTTTSDACPWAVPWATTGWPTTQFWTQKNGCSDPGAMPSAPYDGNSTTGKPLPCKALAGCDPNYPVALCLYDYSDQWDGPHAFPVQWGAKAVTDFFVALPRVP